MKKILIIISVFLFSCSTSKVYQTRQRYCIVVGDVRYGVKQTSIRPVCQNPKYKGKMKWYRYPTKNVSVGDTVDVCDIDIIEPRF